MKKVILAEKPTTTTLTAANDNPGGSQTTKVALASLVTLIAQTYVAKLKEEQKR